LEKIRGLGGKKSTAILFSLELKFLVKELKLSRREEVNCKPAVLGLLDDMKGYIKIAVHLFDESAELSGDERRIVIDDGFHGLD
jgi:hypothetical protein